MKHAILLLSLLNFGAVLAQEKPVGIFDDHVDIGSPKVSGSSYYDGQSQAYTLKGGGYDIWYAKDEFHFSYKKLAGDFIVTADFEFEGAGADPHRKIGWMVRESKDENASHVSAVTHGDGLTVMQWRRLNGALMRDPEDQILTPKRAYRTIHL
jgi:hypothetical protein